MSEEIKELSENKGKTTEFFHPGSENLVNLADRTPEEREEIARKGGIASGEAKREAKLISQLYEKYFASKHGKETVEEAIDAIIQRKDSATVSMLKEAREATEGTKLEIINDPLTEFIKNLRQE
jgi:general stress protein YciG